MLVWLDANLSPALAPWIAETFGVAAESVIATGRHALSDRELFRIGCERGAIILTKDSDFVELVDTLGSPPQVVLITCGNTSNAALQSVLTRSLGRALELLRSGESLVVIEDRPA